MRKERLHSCPELIDYINEIGFLPLLSMGVEGWSAEEVTDEDCQYTRLPDGGWEWPLWTWKGAILQEDFCNYRRSVCPRPEEGSIEESILDILRTEGSLITRDLRAACGFTGPKMRSRFDAYLTRLEMVSSIHTTVTDGNMAGDGLCSLRPKRSSDARLATPTARHKNRARGCSTISKRFCRTSPRKSKTSCSDNPSKTGLLYLSYLRRRRQNSLVKWNLMCLKSICAIWST